MSPPSGYKYSFLFFLYQFGLSIPSHTLRLSLILFFSFWIYVPESSISVTHVYNQGGHFPISIVFLPILTTFYNIRLFFFFFFDISLVIYLILISPSILFFFLLCISLSPFKLFPSLVLKYTLGSVSYSTLSLTDCVRCCCFFFFTLCLCMALPPLFFLNMRFAGECNIYIYILYVSSD